MSATVGQVFPGCDVVNVAPNTEPWLAWRRDGLGGSDIPIILGHSPYKDATPMRVCADKLGLIPDPGETWPMKRGRLLEPVARGLLQQRLAASVRVVCLQRKDCPHHRVSLDGWFLHGPGRQLQIVEIKAYGEEKHNLLGEIEKSGDIARIPYDLMLQAQWQLYVSGASVCHLCSYWQRTLQDDSEASLHRIPILPEPSLIARHVLPAAEKFWARLSVLRRVGYGVGGVSLDLFDEDYRAIFGE